MASSRRNFRWLLMLVLVAAVVGIYVLASRLAELGPELEVNRFLLPTLSIGLVVLVLVLAGILIRNLVQLVVERKKGILGSQLRSKLVFFFVALMLLPALILFVGSGAFIKKTVEGMVRTPVEEITQNAREIFGIWSDHLEGQAVASAERIATDRGPRPGPRGEPVDWVVWIDGDRQRVWTADRPELEEGVDAVEPLFAGLVEEVREQGRSRSGIERMAGGLVVQAAVPRGEGGGVVCVGYFVARDMVSRMERITAGTATFQQFRLQRKELVNLYLTLIALVFLITVFAASWMGFYLARRITVPLQELAEASRQISAGNLDVRVVDSVGDEVGTLVEAFNDMAAQLQESREVIVRSTADLRRSNRELDERRRYIETLIASLSTAVISLDDHGYVTTTNPAVESVLGLSLRFGDPLAVRVEEPGLEPLGEMLRHFREDGGETVRRDLTLSRAESSVNVAVQISGLRGAGGEPLGTLLMAEDLTDLLRAQKAAAWREVARRIAHEIKNPLTPIQLSAQRLRRKFAAGAEDLQQVVPEATASIEREVGALKHLVDEFSRFARMPEVNPRPVRFDEVVDSVQALYRGVPGLEWRVDTDTDMDSVRVDEEQMRRALINLIDNAVAAMEGSGTIYIRAHEYAGPGSLRIEVADSGPGIPLQDRDKMFVPYFSTKDRGSGLGLAIVHRVITDHRGTIRIEDNEPTGARFVIEIPA